MEGENRGRGGDPFCSQHDQTAAAQGRTAPPTTTVAQGELWQWSRDPEPFIGKLEGPTSGPGVFCGGKEASGQGKHKGQPRFRTCRTGQKKPLAIKHKTSRRAGKGTNGTANVLGGQKGTKLT